jgi:hypothetical protein
LPGSENRSMPLDLKDTGVVSRGLSGSENRGISVTSTVKGLVSRGLSGSEKRRPREAMGQGIPGFAGRRKPGHANAGQDC